MLKQMDLEITTNSNLDKNNSKTTFTNYKKKYDDLKSKHFKIKENYTYTKKMEEMINNSQREAAMDIENGLLSQQILKNEEVVGKSAQKLDKAKRAVIEMENISKNVMTDLESQTQILSATQTKLMSLNTVIENSSSVIYKIINKENRNKALVGVFSVTILTLFLFILSSRL